jgi:hypothetical protein
VAVIGELLAVNALFRLRAAQGVLGLATKYGADRLELACAKAMAAGDPSYRTAVSIPRRANSACVRGHQANGTGLPTKPCSLSAMAAPHADMDMTCVVIE